jgi:glycosyltransferase involved in cell wall biosynthesis
MGNSRIPMMVSLVVPTRNRVTELVRLLRSLDIQTYKNFEVIVIDQNDDSKLLLPVLAQHPEMTIVHLRSAPGVSRARNVGIRIARGAVIGFPDDDCWYPADLLANVVQWLDANPEYGGLFTATRSEENKLQAPRFPLQRGACTKKSILRCAVIVSTFFRAGVVKTIGFFQEDIGPGTASPYQSGEDIDFVIRPLDHNVRLFYEPDLTVYHPDLNSRERLRRVTFSYSVGLSHVLRSHDYSWLVFCELVGRSVSGALYHLVRGDLEGAYIYTQRAAGQLRGYMSPPLAPQTTGKSTAVSGDK